jgi:hypothetical protein
MKPLVPGPSTPSSSKYDRFFSRYSSIRPLQLDGLGASVIATRLPELELVRLTARALKTAKRITNVTTGTTMLRVHFTAPLKRRGGQASTGESPLGLDEDEVRLAESA